MTVRLRTYFFAVLSVVAVLIIFGVVYQYPSHRIRKPLIANDLEPTEKIEVIQSKTVPKPASKLHKLKANENVLSKPEETANATLVIELSKQEEKAEEPQESLVKTEAKTNVTLDIAQSTPKEKIEALPKQRVPSTTKSLVETKHTSKNVLLTSKVTSPRTTKPVRPLIVIWGLHKFKWTVPVLSNGDGGCDVTIDRSNVDKADAVVFFMKRTNPVDRPKHRRRNQAYVWWSMESPGTVKNHYRRSLVEYDNFFNWTMTYRTDSDVLEAMWPIPALDFLLLRLGKTNDMYDKMLTKRPRISEEDFRNQTEVLLSRKTKFVASVISDCAVTSQAKLRRELVTNLGRLGNITINRYGLCSGNPIRQGFNNLLPVLSPFKFFLAFENSKHCRDYLTEKTVYNCFVGAVVPVIHGPTRGDTAKLLPKGSYIHVEDFPDLKALGDHLNYLNKNDTAYLEYFSWWKDPGAQTYPRYGFNYGPKFLPHNPKYPHFGFPEMQQDWLEYERFGMYHLCRKLKRGDHLHKTKVIPSLAEWWYGTEAKECYDNPFKPQRKGVPSVG